MVLSEKAGDFEGMGGALMAKRLIDANLLEEAVHDSKNYNPHMTSVARQNHMHEHDHFLKLIALAPTVDAVEVVHGLWVHVPSSDMMTGKAYKCSECGKMRYGSFMPNYCANCGAKMDKEVSNAN